MLALIADAQAESGLAAALLVLLPLIGTVVGGLITAGVSYVVARLNRDAALNLEDKRHETVSILETSRTQREDERRWDRDLMEKSAAFVEACYVISIACERRIADLSADPARLEGPGNTSRESLRNGTSINALTSLLFVAPSNVGQEAREWHSVVNDLLRTVIFEDRHHQYFIEGMSSYWSEFRDHRREFVSLVRRSLVSNPAEKDYRVTDWTSSRRSDLSTFDPDDFI